MTVTAYEIPIRAPARNLDLMISFFRKWQVAVVSCISIW